MALSAMMMTNLLTGADFISQLPWTMVVMMGGISSVSSLFQQLGLNGWIADGLAPYVGPFVSNPYLLITIVSILIYVLRQFIIDSNSCVLIAMALFGSLAAANGIPLIVTVFVAFVPTNTFNIPQLALAYLPAEAATGGYIVHKDIKSTAYAFFAFNILGFLASVPIWRIIGILG